MDRGAIRRKLTVIGAPYPCQSKNGKNSFPCPNLLLSLSLLYMYFEKTAVFWKFRLIDPAVFRIQLTATLTWRKYKKTFILPKFNLKVNY